MYDDNDAVNVSPEVERKRPSRRKQEVTIYRPGMGLSRKPEGSVRKTAATNERVSSAHVGDAVEGEGFITRSNNNCNENLFDRRQRPEITKDCNSRGVGRGRNQYRSERSQRNAQWGENSLNVRHSYQAKKNEARQKYFVRGEEKCWESRNTFSSERVSKLSRSIRDDNRLERGASRSIRDDINRGEDFDSRVEYSEGTTSESSDQPVNNIVTERGKFSDKTGGSSPRRVDKHNLKENSVQAERCLLARDNKNQASTGANQHPSSALNSMELCRDLEDCKIEDKSQNVSKLLTGDTNLGKDDGDEWSGGGLVVERSPKNCSAFSRNRSNDKFAPPMLGEGDSGYLRPRISMPPSELPPRFQKQIAQQQMTVPGRDDSRRQCQRGGLLHLPNNVRLDQSSNSWPSSNKTHENRRPLIAVKPQPHLFHDQKFSPQPVPIPPVLVRESHSPASCASKPRIKPIVQKNLEAAAILERELTLYLSQDFPSQDSNALAKCRWKLQLRYENVILADPRYCAEHNVEHSLWKNVFYNCIEYFRNVIERDKDESAKQMLLILVDEGTMFYENLLEKLEETFGVKLSDYVVEERPRPALLPDLVRLLLICAQKIYIALGDLARYREQTNNTSNYGKARSWYLKAQTIAPKNGRPYNQLAVLAVKSRHRLEAVYYYMRSLTASNPHLSAKESLITVFDEVRKKYESERQENRSGKVKSAPRCEIWIRPDGSTSQRDSRFFQNERRRIELEEMSTTLLYKRYVLSFLHVHGKLFSRVGMESFDETAHAMFLEFKTILNRSPAFIVSSRHLHLLAINIFSVANASLKDSTLSADCRCLLQQQSLQSALTHAAHLMQRAAALLRCHLKSSEFPAVMVSPDVSELLPAIKIWCDWMSCQKRLWSPPPHSANFDASLEGDVWSSFADLLTVLFDLTQRENVTFSCSADDGHSMEVCLPEDAFFAGFLPLYEAPAQSYYASSSHTMETLRNLLRINRIQFFGDYLCGMPSPYLDFEVERRSFKSVVPTSDRSNSISPAREIFMDIAEPERERKECSGADETCWLGEDEEIGRLRTQKEHLVKSVEQQERLAAYIESVLQDENKSGSVVLEVCPRFLVPDTNCFIDYLFLIEKVVASNLYHLYVPLVVVNELEGLSRGDADQEGHALHVAIIRGLLDQLLAVTDTLSKCKNLSHYMK